MTNHLAVDVADGVLRVTFRRPEAFNALREEMAVGLVASLDRAAVDDDIRVVAIAGSDRRSVRARSSPSPPRSVGPGRCGWRSSPRR